MIYPTKHAIGITIDDNTQILIHFGSGTAELIEGAEKLDALSALMRHMAGHEDTFTEEYFCLVLNDAHPDYKELKKRSGAFSALYHEVFASALEELFIVLRRDFGEKFDAAEVNDVVQGTIAHAAIYMIKTFDIQMDADITTLHTSIRKAVYKQLKGATKR